MMSQNYVFLSSDQSDSSLPFLCSDIASGPKKLMNKPDPLSELGVEGVVWGQD